MPASLEVTRLVLVSTHHPAKPTRRRSARGCVREVNDRRTMSKANAREEGKSS